MGGTLPLPVRQKLVRVLSQKKVRQQMKLEQTKLTDCQDGLTDRQRVRRTAKCL